MTRRQGHWDKRLGEKRLERWLGNDTLRDSNASMEDGYQEAAGSHEELERRHGMNRIVLGVGDSGHDGTTDGFKKAKLEEVSSGLCLSSSHLPPSTSQHISH